MQMMQDGCKCIIFFFSSPKQDTFVLIRDVFIRSLSLYLMARVRELKMIIIIIIIIIVINNNNNNLMQLMERLLSEIEYYI